MSKFLARVRVLLTAAPTWIIAAVAVVQVAAVEAAKVLPEEADTIAAWSARAVALLLGIVAVVRRVTPVLPQERGLLTPPSGLVDRGGNPVD
jgi:hypothetical protein